MLITVIFADHSITKFYHPVRHILDRIIMCNHHDRISIFLVNGLDQLQDFLRSIIIQRTCRFITEQDVRIFDNCTSNRGSLLLSSGKLVRQLVLMLINSQCVHQFIHIQRTVTQISTNLNIFPEGQVRNQIVHLENVTQMLSPVQ